MKTRRVGVILVLLLVSTAALAQSVAQKYFEQLEDFFAGSFGKAILMARHSTFHCV